MEKLISLIGLFGMVGLAYLFSSNRKKINWKVVITGVGLQFILSFLILKLPWGRLAFDKAKQFFIAILGFTADGSQFIFGDLANSNKVGFVFATMVLPTIIFFSSLMSVLYHLGIMQKVVRGMAKFIMKVMGTSSTESLAAAANIFVGQTEAPLVIRPYVEKMTKSELMALMSGGMATVAGGVLAAYVGMGIDAGHLLAASVMSAPAALVCAKLMVPEVESSQTAGDVKIELKATTTNVIDAATTGAADGLKLAMNVGAMLLAFIALISMLNAFLGQVGSLVGVEGLNFELILGYLFSPFAYLMGVPWSESFVVGTLLGKKLIINEFVAYLDLQQVKESLSERSVIISTYALCGFANFSSIAIQVGGIGTIAPGRKKDLAKLGFKSLIAGTLACLMTACIAGIFI